MNPISWLRGRGLREWVRTLRARLARTDPVIVFQMGKVGSSSLYASLRALRPPREVFQVHLLHDLDRQEARVHAGYTRPTGTLPQFAKARALADRIARDDRRWTVISVVRDPVERNVSAFFQVIGEFVPDALERAARGEVTVTELLEVFLGRYEQSAPITWFQAQMAPVFGIDVLAVPFDRERGWQTYESDRARLLVLRLEDLPRVAEPAVRAFLDAPDFTLVTANVGDDKSYAALYRQFRAEVVLPADHLDRMYDSDYARCFYSADEIAAARARWERRT